MYTHFFLEQKSIQILYYTTHTHTQTHTYIYIYIYYKVLVITISLHGFVADQMPYNLESVQHL